MVRAFIVALVMMTCALPSGGSEYSVHPRVPDDERGIAQAATEDFKDGKFDEAVTKYHQILAKYPDSLYAWSNIGVVRSQQGHLDDARDAFEHALKLQPRDAFCLVDSGMVYLQLKDYATARDRYKRAIALEPRNFFAHAGLAEAYQHLGQPRKAARESAITAKLDRDGAFRAPLGTRFPPIDDRSE